MGSRLALAVTITLAFPVGCVAAEPELALEDTAQALELDNGLDWNGIDWNGIDWNGIDWNGIDWNGIDWNGIDWNGIDAVAAGWSELRWEGSWTPIDGALLAWEQLDPTTVDWNAVDWRGVASGDVPWTSIDWGDLDWAAIDWEHVSVQAVIGARDGVVGVHPRSRPLFVFVSAHDAERTFPLAVPGPGALDLLAQAPDRGAALHFLEKSWQIAYGPGFHLLAGRFDRDGDGHAEPFVVEGRLGVAPTLAGLGPYHEPQVAAWSSLIGNLLNLQPFRLSIRAYQVAGLASTAGERSEYPVTDLRGAIGRIIPPPEAPQQASMLVLFRDRMRMMSMSGSGGSVDELDQRRACPLIGTWSRCYDGRVTVVDLRLARFEGIADCTGIVGSGPFEGSVSGSCSITLPHVTYTQDASLAPIAASFVGMRDCGACGAQ